MILIGKLNKIFLFVKELNNKNLHFSNISNFRLFLIVLGVVLVNSFTVKIN